jgi:hypothetical protein
MDVWVLLWEYPADPDTNVTLWTSQKAAQQQALSEINDHINSQWDMDEPDAYNCAEEIRTLEQAGKLQEAIEKWNDHESEQDYGQFYTVMKREVIAGDGEVIPATPPVAYKASSPGATCRGPHREHNPYAYADRPDGTYLCTQCKTFGHIFGTNKP